MMLAAEAGVDLEEVLTQMLDELKARQENRDYQDE
jgi:hypothetical protein